jgi:putative ABC transport system substrate-binding protein
LNAAGYVEGQNVLIEYRWADGDFGRVREAAAELVRRRVTLIAATGGTAVAKIVKTATETIPILFVSGFDPVQFGLVASLSRPGGNATGLSLHTTELVSKRMELVRELTPKAKKIALLVNPQGVVAKIETKELEEGTARAGLGSLVLHASADNDFESAFASAMEQGAEALLVSADPFFTSNRDRITMLAASHKLPAVYPWREYAAAGGLMSYGPSITNAFEQIGRYAGRILKGAKPADLPVQVPTKFELAINVTTAQALGLSVSPWMLARADEVIQ